MSDFDYTLDDSLAFLPSLADDEGPDDDLKAARQFKRMIRSAYTGRRSEAGAQLRYRGYLALCRRLGDPNAVPGRIQFECRIRNKLRSLTMATFKAREAKRAAVAKMVEAMEVARG